MGLAVRIIPTLLMRGDQLVKGERFNSWRSVGLVAQAVKTHQKRGVDELILLDIDATPSGRGPNFGAIERLCDGCFSPITVGGGVRTVEDVRKLLAVGADKIAIHSHPEILKECADSFGSQALVALLDYSSEFSWNVPQLARMLFEHGAGEIVLTAMDKEGMMSGYDVDTIEQVSSTVPIPVIAHGGCGSYEDMRLAIEAGASAVAAGAFFQFTDNTPKGAAKYLSGQGIETRVE